MLNIDQDIQNSYSIIKPKQAYIPIDITQPRYNKETTFELHKYPYIMSNNKNIASPNWNNGYFINTNTPSSAANDDPFDTSIPPQILEQQPQPLNTPNTQGTNQLTQMNDSNYLALTKQQQQQPPNGSSTSKKPKHTKSKPAFVMKLWTMVNDEHNHELIDWYHDGLSFLVTNRELFVQKILPKYFKHSNFASFVRQLNMYGWHKVQDANSGSLHSDEKWQFINPNFQKDKPKLLDKIVRNKPNDSDQQEHTQQSNQHNSTNFDVSVLINELNTLKTNQMKITQELSRVRSDNELLWKELFNTREKNLLQNEKIEKILHFLASVYGNKVKVLEDHMNYNNNQLLQNQASFELYQQQHAQSQTPRSQDVNVSEPSSTPAASIDPIYPESLISPRFQKPRLMIKQTRHVSNPNTEQPTPSQFQESPVQEIVRSPGKLPQQQQSQQPQSPFSQAQSQYSSQYFPSDDFQKLHQQQQPQRPSLQPQPSFEDLSKTIEQQGQSINDIITRIQQSQPQQFDQLEPQQVATPSNLQSNFDLDEFLNQDLLPDDEAEQKVGTIREILEDDVNGEENNGKHKDNDDEEIEEIINPSKKRKSGERY